MLRHRTDQEDPAYAVEWTDRAGDLIDFSTYDAFEIVLEEVDTGKRLLTKVSGFTAPTPIDGQPNLIASWSVNELISLPAVEVYIHLKATKLTRDRVFRPGNPEVMRLVAPPPA